MLDVAKRAIKLQVRGGFMLLPLYTHVISCSPVKVNTPTGITFTNEINLTSQENYTLHKSAPRLGLRKSIQKTQTFLKVQPLYLKL